MMVWNTKKQCLHFKHRALDFPGRNMKKTKRIYTVTQEETCFNREHFTGNDEKSFWENLEGRELSEQNRDSHIEMVLKRVEPGFLRQNERAPHFTMFPFAWSPAPATPGF